VKASATAFIGYLLCAAEAAMATRHEKSREGALSAIPRLSVETTRMPPSASAPGPSGFSAC
jgi:hypothetical protein